VVLAPGPALAHVRAPLPLLRTGRAPRWIRAVWREETVFTLCAALLVVWVLTLLTGL
jgi:hypothetical protein